MLKKEFNKYLMFVDSDFDIHKRDSGADPGFSLGGGGAQKIMCAQAHYEGESPFRQGSRARLRALQAWKL